MVKLCYNSTYVQTEILDKIVRKGGLVAYLGTDDAREVELKFFDGYGA